MLLASFGEFLICSKPVSRPIRLVVVIETKSIFQEAQVTRVAASLASSISRGDTVQGVLSLMMVQDVDMNVGRLSG